MGKGGYRTISIADKLYKDIEPVAERLRYDSIAEFVRDAIRRRLEDIARQERASNTP